MSSASASEQMWQPSPSRATLLTSTKLRRREQAQGQRPRASRAGLRPHCSRDPKAERPRPEERAPEQPQASPRRPCCRHEVLRKHDSATLRVRSKTRSSLSLERARTPRLQSSEVGAPLRPPRHPGPRLRRRGHSSTPVPRPAEDRMQYYSLPAARKCSGTEPRSAVTVTFSEPRAAFADVCRRSRQGWGAGEACAGQS